MWNEENELEDSQYKLPEHPIYEILSLIEPAHPMVTKAEYLLVTRRKYNQFLNSKLSDQFFIDRDGEALFKEGSTIWTKEYWLKEGYLIHSVRRLSDGLVITVGDIVQYGKDPMFESDKSSYIEPYQVEKIGDCGTDVNIMGFSLVEGVKNACMLSVETLRKK